MPPGSPTRMKPRHGCPRNPMLVLVRVMPHAPQDELVYRLPHAAGLNPKAFQGRYARAGAAQGGSRAVLRPLRPGDNSMLQGDVVDAYSGLDARSAAAIADAVGAEPAELTRDLSAIAAAASFL